MDVLAGFHSKITKSTGSKDTYDERKAAGNQMPMTQISHTGL